MPRKKTTTKIIEDELRRLGEKVYEETKATVRVSKDRFNKEGEQTHEGGTLRDSINYYPKGKKLEMSQINYGKFQKPKKLGDTPWHPPASANSGLWENPLADSISKHIPETVNVISKSLLGNILNKSIK